MNIGARARVRVCVSGCAGCRCWRKGRSLLRDRSSLFCLEHGCLDTWIANAPLIVGSSDALNTLLRCLSHPSRSSRCNLRQSGWEREKPVVEAALCLLLASLGAFMTPALTSHREFEVWRDPDRRKMRFQSTLSASDPAGVGFLMS